MLKGLPGPNGRLLQALREIMPADTHSWLDGLALALAGMELTVRLPHRHFAAWFQQAHRQNFERALRSLPGCAALCIRYETESGSSLCARAQGSRPGSAQYPAQEAEKSAPACGPGAATTFEPSAPPPRHSRGFATFFSDGRNDFALACARALASQRGEAAFNPLLLCGPGGVGKTHLLRAVEEELAATRAPGRVAAGPARRICGELLRYGQDPEQFWHEYDALLLDDVHLLAGEPELQAQLTAIMDASPRLSGAAQASIYPMLATTGPELARAGLEAGLAGRLAAGLLARLWEPALDARLAWLEAVARERGLRAPRALLLRLARAGSHMRALQGMWRRLEAFMAINGRLPEGEDLEELAQGPAAGLDPILEEVAQLTGQSREQIMGQGRGADISRARQTAMFVCRVRLGLSYPELGRLFGRDHSTIIHAIKKIEKLRESDKDVHMLLTRLLV